MTATWFNGQKVGASQAPGSALIANTLSGNLVKASKSVIAVRVWDNRRRLPGPAQDMFCVPRA